MSTERTKVSKLRRRQMSEKESQSNTTRASSTYSRSISAAHRCCSREAFQLIVTMSSLNRKRRPASRTSEGWQEPALEELEK